MKFLTLEETKKMTFIQTEIPQPEETQPYQEWGWYSFQDFFVANWFYVTVTVIIAIIVFIYARHKKKQRVKYQEQLKAEQENSKQA